MFIPDTNVGYLILIVLPIIAYYFFQFRGKELTLYAIFSFSFISGSIELLLGFNPNLLKQIIEITILLLTIYVLITTRKPHFPLIKYVIIFLIISFISFAISDVDIIQFLLFIRKYFLIIVIYILFSNINFNFNSRDKFLNFIIALFISQIFVNLIRFPITGQSEPYIGTMSVKAGSTTAIFALVAISFSFSAFLYLRQRLYLLITLGFFLFAIIGDKRVIIFFMPIIIAFVYIHFVKVNTNKQIFNFKNLSIMLLLTLSIIYGTVRLLPTLNPENKIGGSFDLDYTINYIENYLNPGTKVLGSNFYGRGEAPIAVYNLLVNEYGLSKFLFGLGPGDIIMSKYSTPTSYLIDRAEDITVFKYDIGYGTRTGLIYTGLQVGLIGIIFYFIIIFKSISSPYTNKYNNISFQLNRNKILELGLYGAKWIFVLDFFLYSRTFYESIPIILSVYYINYYLNNSLLQPNRIHSVITPVDNL